MSQPRIKTWAEVKGNAVDLIYDKQKELKKTGATEKNLGVVINILLNEYYDLIKKKK